MVEINLKEIQHRAYLKFVEEGKAKAKKFAQEEAVTQLIEAADKMFGYATISVPAEIPVEEVVTELNKILVESKIEARGHKISVYWF
jgi:hypothetical protein